jgi:hypothetical protein
MFLPVPGRNTLQNTLSKYFVKIQSIHVDVADVAAAGGLGASPRSQGFFKTGIVNVSDWLPIKVTAANNTVAIHGNYILSGSALMPHAQVAGVVDGK